ncbi:MAG: arginine--tRNA ligase [Phycisphaerae bacterium]
MNLKKELESRLKQALASAGAPENAPALVAVSTRPEADYQANGVMAAAKRMKTNPRQLAEKVLESVDLSDLAESVEVAGPGFINVRLSTDWLAQQAAAMLIDEKLGVPQPDSEQTVVVDYSSPNLAKEMHVGHLRSTIIGDALGRVMEFTGKKVIRQNHVGDWGTQFGMLIAHMEEVEEGSGELADLEEFYRQAKQRFDSDADFAERSRGYVVKLQGGDAECLEKWKKFLEISLSHCGQVYEQLGVMLGTQDVRGESFYNEDLPKVIEDLREQGMLAQSEGAQCVFLEGYANKDGEPLPVIVQKSGGGYLYATTDLAAIRYRARKLNADRVLYVTDSRQAQHFEMVFKVARLAGFVGEDVSLEHVGFGMMLGKDKRPFKTREGGTVKLMDLLKEAQQRALSLVKDKNPDLPEDKQGEIASAVGVGAVKYADLSQNRTSDYVFSWDKMLSLQGNTAPYMQYAYTRVRSIFRKGDLADDAAVGEIRIDEPAERQLALQLSRFAEAIQTVESECLPNVLCAYLYELATAFMSFYESCPVLKAESEEIRRSRLMLAKLTADVIRTGLDLLGIRTIEQM